MSLTYSVSLLKHLRLSLGLCLALLVVSAPDIQAQAHVPGSSDVLQGLRNFGTSGKAVYPFVEGSKTEAELFDHEGKGCLTHMWFGGKWQDYERMRIRVYVDGEAKASIDMELFLGTYFFNLGTYTNEVAGLTHLNKEDKSFSAYRFHEEDPIFFAKGLRLTLRCGEQVENQVHNQRLQTWKAPPTTYTGYVWIYEW